jgi:hypothetical protein
MSDEFKLTDAEIQKVLAARQEQAGSAEEDAILDRAAQTAKQEIEQFRAGTSQAQLMSGYEAARGQLARKHGRSTEAFRRELIDLRVEYRKKGLRGV